MGLFSNDFKEEYDYLLLKQPKPTDVVISNDMYLKYTRSKCAPSDCFVWNQPLSFTVNQHYKQWNELMLNSQSFSEILKEDKNNACCVSCGIINDHCFCQKEDQACSMPSIYNPFKYSLTATDRKSDINLYTDYWEKTTEVYYFAQNDFSLSANLGFDGANTSQVNIAYTEQPNLFSNISNDNFKSTVAWFVNKNELVSKKDLGFFRPNVFNSGKWEHSLTTDGIGASNNLTYNNGELEKSHKQYQNQFDVSKNKVGGCGLGQNQTCLFQPFQIDENSINRIDSCSSETIEFKSAKSYTEDIFGNKYFITKEIGNNDNTVYRKRDASGQGYVDNVNGTRRTIKEQFFTPIDKIYPYALEYNNLSLHLDYIKKIIVVYDTLITITSTFFAVQQLYMDYDKGEPYTIADTTQIFTFYGGLPLFDCYVDKENKMIYFAYRPFKLAALADFKFLKILSYSLNDNKFYWDNNNFDTGQSIFSDYRGTKIVYNNITQNLYVFFIGVGTLFIDPKDFRYVKYKKQGNSFVYVDSVIVSGLPDMDLYNLLECHLYDDNKIFVLIEKRDGTMIPFKITLQ